jgi:hypothetical protein
MAQIAKPYKHAMIERDGKKYILVHAGKGKPKRERRLIESRGNIPALDLLNYAAAAVYLGVRLETLASRQRGGGWRGNNWKPLDEESYPESHPLGFDRHQRFIRRSQLDRVKATEKGKTSPAGRYLRDGAWRLTQWRAAKILGRRSADGRFAARCKKLGAPSVTHHEQEEEPEPKRIRSLESGQPCREFTEAQIVAAASQLHAASDGRLPIDGRPQARLTKFLRDIKKITHGENACGHARNEIIEAWEKHCPYIGEPLRVNRPGQGIAATVDKEESDRILAAVREAKAANGDEPLRLLWRDPVPTDWLSWKQLSCGLPRLKDWREFFKLAESLRKELRDARATARLGIDYIRAYRGEEGGGGYRYRPKFAKRILAEVVAKIVGQESIPFARDRRFNAVREMLRTKPNLKQEAILASLRSRGLRTRTATVKTWLGYLALIGEYCPKMGRPKHIK